ARARSRDRLGGALQLLPHPPAHDLLAGEQVGALVDVRAVADHDVGLADGALRRRGAVLRAARPESDDRERHATRGLKPAGSSRRWARMKPSSARTSRVAPSATIWPRSSTTARGQSSSAYGRSWVIKSRASRND